MDFRRSGRQLRGGGKTARPARRAPRLAVLAARRARLHRARPPPRREMPARAARDADRGDHTRAGCPAQARTEGAQGGRSRRALGQRERGVRGGRCQRLQAIRTRDGATIDPYRAAIGLAAAAAERGAQIFERTAAARTTFGRRTADVVLDDGTIRTNRIVVATGRPTPLFKSLVRHFWFEELVPRADRAGPGQDPPAARAPRRRRPRPGRAAAPRPLGRRRAAAGRRRRRRGDSGRGCATRPSCSGPVS